PARSTGWNNSLDSWRRVYHILNHLIVSACMISDPVRIQGGVMREGFASAGRTRVLAAFTVMLLALVPAPATRAQGVGSTGTISGTVLDESGQVLPGATV